MEEEKDKVNTSDENDEEDADQFDEQIFTANKPEEVYIIEKSPNKRFIRVLFIQYSEMIGKGTYKEVYRGVDLETGKEIAWNKIKTERLPTC